MAESGDMGTMGGAGSTLGDAYVNILGNLNPLAASLAQAKAMTVAAAGTMAATLGGLAVGYITQRIIRESLSAWAEYETALTRLGSAFKIAGEDARVALPSLEKFADEMQSITTYSNNTIISIMASGKTLGIHTDQLKQVTKAAIGLAAAYQGRIGVNTAMYLLVRAAHGNTYMLSRLGIQMEKNLTPQEKFNKLMALGLKYFPIEEDRVKTLSGRLAQLRNAWHDVLTAMGRDIAHAPAFNNSIEMAKDNLNAFVVMWNDWAKSGVLNAVLIGIAAIGKAIWFAANIVALALMSMSAAMLLPFETGFNIIKDGILFIQQLWSWATGNMGMSWQSFWDKVRDDFMGMETVKVIDFSMGEFTEQFKGWKEWWDHINKQVEPGTQPFGGKGPNEDILGGAGKGAAKVMQAAEAWKALTEMAAKDESDKLLGDIAENTATIAANTKQSAPGAVKVLPGAPPLSSPGTQDFVPGSGPGNSGLPVAPSYIPVYAAGLGGGGGGGGGF